MAGRSVMIRSRAGPPSRHSPRSVRAPGPTLDGVFTLTLPTRHTDTFAATGFVHSGVLIALTEMTYAAFEKRVEIVKPETVVAVQVETQAKYYAPLPWAEGAELSVTTLESSKRGFVQEYEIRSATTGIQICAITHHWVWLDLVTGRRAPIPEDVVTKYRDA